MEYLSWDLAIFSRAVAYANLSTASAHVGLSQPQLSRIVAKLEEQLGISLLDRESKRKSSWTPAAFRLAEIYGKTYQGFRAEISQLAGGMTPHELHVGALEGLTDLAMRFCHQILSQTKVMVVVLEVLDTSFLEERFAKNDLDLIFTANFTSARKFRYAKDLGWQSVETVAAAGMHVYSMYELQSTVHRGTPTAKAFASNSLRVRQEWLSTYGGTGTKPTPIRRERTGAANEVTVSVVAHDNLPALFWEQIVALLS